MFNVKRVTPFVGMNKINCYYHICSATYKYKTSRLGYSDIEKWLSVIR